MAKHTTTEFWNKALINADRLARGWTYRDLSRAAGRDPAGVSRFLNGPSQSPAMAKRLAFALGYPLERYLLAERPELSA